MSLNSFRNWSAKEYLDHYYDLERLSDDDVTLFKFIFDFLKKENAKFSEMIDVGSGPIVHRLVPCIRYTRKIDLADYLPENLNAIKEWLKIGERFHHWEGQIDHILKIGNIKVSQQTIRKQLKQKIRRLLKGDVFRKYPLGKRKSYPLVTSFYCADSITNSKRNWKKAMNHICDMVEPGGYFITAALRNTKNYVVNGKFYPSANVNEFDFKKVLFDNNFNEASLMLKVIPTPKWKADGIDSSLVLIARKNA